MLTDDKVIEIMEILKDDLGIPVFTDNIKNSKERLEKKE